MACLVIVIGAAVTTVAGTVTLASTGSVGVAPSPSESVLVVVPVAPLPNVVPGGGSLVRHTENSEDWPPTAVDVDVAVITVPPGTAEGRSTEKLAAPLPLVVTLTLARQPGPSPFPLAAHEPFPNSSIR